MQYWDRWAIPYEFPETVLLKYVCKPVGVLWLKTTDNRIRNIMNRNYFMIAVIFTSGPCLPRDKVYIFLSRLRSWQSVDYYKHSHNIKYWLSWHIKKSSVETYRQVKHGQRNVVKKDYSFHGNQRKTTKISQN